LLTEALYTPLLTLTVLSFCLAYQHKSLHWALLAGLGCGAAMLARTVALLLPIALGTCCFVSSSRRRAIALVSCLFLGCLVTLSPWLVHKYVKYGTVRPQQRSQGVGILTSYAVMAHYGFVVRPERVPFPYDDPEKAYEEYMEKVWKPLHTPGYTPPVTARYFLSHPWDYVRQTFWRAFQFVSPRSCGQAFGIQLGFGECLRAGRHGQFVFKLALLGFDTLLLFGAVAGAVLGTRRWKDFAPLYAILGYFVVLHFLVHATARYRYPLIPLLAVFAALFYSRVITWVKQGRTCRT